MYRSLIHELSVNDTACAARLVSVQLNGNRPSLNIDGKESEPAGFLWRDCHETKTWRNAHGATLLRTPSTNIVMRCLPKLPLKYGGVRVTPNQSPSALWP
jgi:hypothetical protein